MCPADEQFCDGSVLSVSHCGEAPVALENCAASGQRCDPSRGCTGCITGAAICDGDDVLRCEDGEQYSIVETCRSDLGLGCGGGTCQDLCALAERESTYLGCEHLAVTTLNALLNPEFDFGVVLGNPGDGPAEVHITRGSEELARVTVAPRSAAQVSLPRLEPLASSLTGSELVPNGAYRIVSDRPVAAYQYHPLEFRLRDECVFTGSPDDRACFSFTNDASLLLPVHALGTSYLADARGADNGRGPFLSIAAPDGAHVRVVAPSSIVASPDGVIAAGEVLEVDLDPGAVLQLMVEDELSGASIESDRPILVIAGHNCADVPSTSVACDHLEEIMPPLGAWGRRVIAPAPRSVDGEPSFLRIISAADGNVITLSNAPSEITLDRGKVFEFVTSEDVQIDATAPILVSQYLVSAAYFDRAPPGRPPGSVGDPSMGIASPVEQFRASYAFAVPESFDRNYAAIVAHRGDEVRLDGIPIETWSALGEFAIARVPLFGGAHLLESSLGTSLTLYGVAPYTSYLLPGGLDVELLQ
jgi:hypothetical protein